MMCALRLRQDCLHGLLRQRRIVTFIALPTQRKMPPRARGTPPYLWYAVTSSLKAEIEAACDRIASHLGCTPETRVAIQGHARWVYISSLHDSESAVDYSDMAGKEAAMTTYMNVRHEIGISHNEYCPASNEFMLRRRCAMSSS